MWRLFYPLRYFWLINSEKRQLDILPTFILAAVIAAPYVLLPDAPFFRSGGFLDKLLLLTSALTGFYVAALVAAATFAHDHLDKVITLGAIKMHVRLDGKKTTISLTRRQFTCMLFGYLAFSALTLSIFSAIFISISGVNHEPLESIRWIGFIFSPANFHIVRDIFICLFSLSVAHLAVATSLGLYYLMDRLYRHEPTIVTEKKDRHAA